MRNSVDDSHARKASAQPMALSPLSRGDDCGDWHQKPEHLQQAGSTVRGNAKYSFDKIHDRLLLVFLTAQATLYSTPEAVQSNWTATRPQSIFRRPAIASVMIFKILASSGDIPTASNVWTSCGSYSVNHKQLLHASWAPFTDTVLPRRILPRGCAGAQRKSSCCLHALQCGAP
jgi:hypothetical protein